MRRAPLFLLLLLAACSSAGGVSLVEPPEISTPILTEPVPTTEVATETQEEIEVLHDRVTATTTPETTTTEAPTPVTTTGSPTTTAPAPSPTTTTTTETPGGGYAADMEAAFASKINGLRSSVGVAGLSRNGNLDAYARSWARQMGESGNLGHSNFASLLGPWSTVGENIGYGGSVSAVFSALVNSSGHYSIMVEPGFTSLGVGVWVDANGTLWTCHIFAG